MTGYIDSNIPYPCEGMNPQHTCRSSHLIRDEGFYELLWKREAWLYSKTIDNQNDQYVLGNTRAYRFNREGAATALAILTPASIERTPFFLDDGKWVSTLGGGSNRYRIHNRDRATGDLTWSYIFGAEYAQNDFIVNTDGSYVSVGGAWFPDIWDTYLQIIEQDGTEREYLVEGSKGELYYAAADSTGNIFCYAELRDDNPAYHTYHASIRSFSINGVPRWDYEIAARTSLEKAVVSPPICIGEDDTILFGTAVLGGAVLPFYCLNPDGTVRWTKSLGNTSSALGIAADGTIYAYQGGTLYALDPDDGATIWSYNTGGQIYRILIDSEGKILTSVYGVNGGLLCINPDGSEYWKIVIGTTNLYTYNQTLAVGSDGTIFSFGNLYHSAWGPPPVSDGVVIKCGNKRIYHFGPISKGDSITIMRVGKKRFALPTKTMTAGSTGIILKKDSIMRLLSSKYTAPTYGPP